MKKRNELL
jgi:hypothetical protein